MKIDSIPTRKLWYFFFGLLRKNMCAFSFTFYEEHIKNNHIQKDDEHSKYSAFTVSFIAWTCRAEKKRMNWKTNFVCVVLVFLFWNCSENCMPCMHEIRCSTWKNQCHTIKSCISCIIVYERNIRAHTIVIAGTFSFIRSLLLFLLVCIFSK